MLNLWTVFCLGTLLRVFFWFTSWNSGGDALARVGYTAAWLAHPSLKLDFGPWLPLHFWMIGALAWVLGDVSDAGRLLSLLTGIGSLPLFWWLACELYGRRAALLSLFVFAVYPLHIGYSTNSSSEVPFLFFVLAGLANFFSYRRSQRLSYLAGSGLSLTLAAAIRYEGWILIAVLGLFLLGTALRSLPQPQLHRPLLVFGLTAGMWPVFWIAYEWSATGHPFFFVKANVGSGFFGKYLTGYRTTLWYRLTLPVGTLFLTLSPLPFAASLYGIYRGLKKRNGSGYALLVALIALVQYLTPPHMVFARYTMMLGTMLAIISGFGAEEFRQQLPARHRTRFPAWFAGTAMVSLLLVLLMSESTLPYSNKFRSISPRPLFTHEIASIAEFLRSHLGSDERLIVDDYNYDGGTITYLAGVRGSGQERAFVWARETAGAIEMYLEERKPRYIVYAKESTLRARIGLPRDCGADQVEIRTASFRCVYENSRYVVYEITH